MLKFIKQHAASIEGIGIFPIISLSIFVLFFVAVLYYVKNMDNRSVDEISSLPLDLNEDQEPATNQSLKHA